MDDERGDLISDIVDEILAAVREEFVDPFIRTACITAAGQYADTPHEAKMVAQGMIEWIEQSGHDPEHLTKDGLAEAARKASPALQVKKPLPPK